MSGFQFRLNWKSALHLAMSCIIYHDLAGSSALVVIIASDVCSSDRFFADRTVELMRATTSSPVFFDHVFQASIPPLLPILQLCLYLYC